MIRELFASLMVVMFLVASLHAKESRATNGRGNEAAIVQYVCCETISYVDAGPEKMKWWRDAKFGLFIHWGVYAVPAGLWSKDNTFDRTFHGRDSDLYSPHRHSERLLHATDIPVSK